MRFLKCGLKSVAAALFLFGCATDGANPPYVARSVPCLYREAHELLCNDRFEQASVAFDELDRQHPFSDWSVKGQLMSAYALLRDQKFVRALSALDVFISLHPEHPAIDYAHYLRALCYYDGILSVRHDQKNAFQALQALGAVFEKFPDSLYAQDAREKYHFVSEQLAAAEMALGRFYLHRRQYIPALNRFSTVFLFYPKSAQTPEALYRLIEGNLCLGFRAEAQRAESFLQENFPQTPWYTAGVNLLSATESLHTQKEK